jgi:hypothetical protein
MPPLHTSLHDAATSLASWIGISRCPLYPGSLKGSTQQVILEGRDGVDAMERGYVRGFDAVAKAE